MISAVAAPRETTVLVTGGSGFVGGWVVVALLHAGHTVRATIRDMRREPEVREMIATQAGSTELLSFHEADLLDGRGWDEATSGVDYVLHVASPMPVGEFRKQDVIRPAREGTLRVLEAAAKAGVKRTVVTSSTAAAAPADKVRTVADETIWTELPDRQIYNYPRSKTLAEQDAWAFARRPGMKMEVSTILPSQIQGPVLGKDYSASVDVVALMLKGKMPLLPRLGYGIVDVRDLAAIHLLAMTSPLAAGERFIATGDFLWFSDIARILRARFGEEAKRVSTRIAPDVLIRLAAMFNPEAAQVAPSLGVRSNASSAKAKRLLGWESRTAESSIIDTAASLIKLGLT